MKNITSENKGSIPENEKNSVKKPASQFSPPPKKPAAASAGSSAKKTAAPSSGGKPHNASSQPVRRVVSTANELAEVKKSAAVSTSKPSTSSTSSSAVKSSSAGGSSPSAHRGSATPSSPKKKKTGISGWFSDTISWFKKHVLSTEFFSSPAGLAIIISVFLIIIVVISFILPKSSCFSNEITIDESLYNPTFIATESETDAERYKNIIFAAGTESEDVNKLQNALLSLKLIRRRLKLGTDLCGYCLTVNQLHLYFPPLFCDRQNFFLNI